MDHGARWFRHISSAETSYHGSNVDVLMISSLKLRRDAWTWLVALVAVTPACSRGQKGLAAAPQAIDLVPFGYRAVVAPMILREGFSTVTIDFADDEHVLLTFAQRKLVPRLPDHDTNHPDRLIRAVVIHLPEGKVVRETEWRSHDIGRYLWQVHDGLFLVRIENTLYSMDALHDGRRDDKLERTVLLRVPAQIESVQSSPSGDLLLVESSPAKHVGDDPNAAKPDLPITASFYRLERSLATGSMEAQLRGTAKARSPFAMTFTSAGVLETVREDRQHWGFDFHPFGGAVDSLAGFTSTCRPQSYFVSDGEFFSAGCRGGEDRRLLAGFNLLAEPSWVFTTDDPPAWLAFATAPAAGRFALRNTLLRSTAVDPEHMSIDDVRTQEVRVYNVRDGQELLRVPCSPAMRATQNFAISPDGRRVATLDGNRLMIYALPPPSNDDLKKLEQSAAAVRKHEDARRQPIESVLQEQP